MNSKFQNKRSFTARPVKLVSWSIIIGADGGRLAKHTVRFNVIAKTCATALKDAENALGDDGSADKHEIGINPLQSRCQSQRIKPLAGQAPRKRDPTKLIFDTAASSGRCR